MAKKKITTEREWMLREKKILGAALVLSNLFDCRSITVDQIAARAEIAKGTIYHHFPSKDEIYARLVLDFNRSILRKLGQVSHTQATTPRLKELVRVLLESYATNREYRWVLEYCGREDFRRSLTEEIRHALDSLESEITKQFEEMISDGIREGAISPGSSRQLYYGIQSTLFGGAARAVWNRYIPEEKIDDYIEGICAYIFAALTLTASETTTLSTPEEAVASSPVENDLSKQEMLYELMRVTGLNELYSRQDEMECQHYWAEFQNAIDEISRSHKDDPARTAIEAAAAKYADALLEDLHALDRVSLYAALLSEQVTASDLSRMLEYYKSPVGQKDIRATREIVEKVMAQMQASRSELLQKNLEGFKNDMDRIVLLAKKHHTGSTKH